MARAGLSPAECVDAMSVGRNRGFLGLRGKEPESREDVCPRCSLTSPARLKPGRPLTVLPFLSFLSQALPESGQGRLSGPQQHVAVPRPEEPLQKGKACGAGSARERRAGPRPKDTMSGPDRMRRSREGHLSHRLSN